MQHKRCACAPTKDDLLPPKVPRHQQQILPKNITPKQSYDYLSSSKCRGGLTTREQHHVDRQRQQRGLLSSHEQCGEVHLRPFFNRLLASDLDKLHLSELGSDDPQRRLQQKFEEKKIVHKSVSFVTTIGGGGAQDFFFLLYPHISHFW